MSDAGFAELFAISQVAPGPSILLVSLIGWRVAGLPGLLIATIAITPPPSLLAWAMGRAMAHWSNRPALRTLKRGLVPVALGLMLASGAVTAQAADDTLLTAAISGATVAFVLLSRWNPLWMMAIGAAATMAL
jgi:chromate transporter